MNILTRNLLLPVLALGLATSAPATLLSLNISGAFDPTSTLGGTAFGKETPFTMRAEFDPCANHLPSGSREGEYSLTALHITIQGFPTYAATPSALTGLVAMFAAPCFKAPGIYYVGVGCLGSGGLAAIFAAATPAFDPSACGLSVFSGGK